MTSQIDLPLEDLPARLTGRRIVSADWRERTNDDMCDYGNDVLALLLDDGSVVVLTACGNIGGEFDAFVETG